MSETKPRRRKRRKVFTKSYDEDELDNAAANAELRAFGFLVDEEEEEEIAQKWGYDLKSKIDCSRFEEFYDEIVERLEGKDFTAQYFRDRGFKKPIYFNKSDGLGLSVPLADNFTVQDVKRLVGATRTIDVVDVKTQKGSQMTLREFVDYFQKKDRTQLLNVLSLEFSKTKLADYVRAPDTVRALDWVELAWPRELREQQTDATNALSSMKYPKVQNYCLMSVGDCYTDFHIDFGGTSVWYHVLRGEKLFWLIPPTDENCQHFQAWTLSGRQNQTFFGDLVEKCVRIKLRVGDTFMIPSGWIHAVYTPVDSLVFGGNFLHSFAIPMQLSVFEIEKNTHVPGKFRYPFFMEMQWYVLERYYQILTGRTFVRRTDTTDGDADSNSNKDQQDDGEPKLNEEAARSMSEAELAGLRVLVDWMQATPMSKRKPPDLIRQPNVLLKKLQDLLPTLNSMQRQPSSTQQCVLSIGRSRQSVEQIPPPPSHHGQQQQYAKASTATSSKQPKVDRTDLNASAAQMPTTSSSISTANTIGSTQGDNKFDQEIHSYAMRSPGSGKPPPGAIILETDELGVYENPMNEANEAPSSSNNHPPMEYFAGVSNSGTNGHDVNTNCQPSSLTAANRSRPIGDRSKEIFERVARQNVPNVGAECTIETNSS